MPYILASFPNFTLQVSAFIAFAWIWGCICVCRSFIFFSCRTLASTFGFNRSICSDFTRHFCGLVRIEILFCLWSMTWIFEQLVSKTPTACLCESHNRLILGVHLMPSWLLVYILTYWLPSRLFGDYYRFFFGQNTYEHCSANCSFFAKLIFGATFNETTVILASPPAPRNTTGDECRTTIFVSMGGAPRMLL